VVLMVPQSGKNPLAGLLTNVSRQANNIAFNLQFNNLQNTVISRLNKETEKLTDASGNQRELDELKKSYDKTADQRNSIVKFAFSNEANGDLHSDLSSAISSTISALNGSSDGDSDNVSASELAAYETARDEIVSISDRLVELNHPDFIDGNNVTLLRAQIEELLEYTAVEGVVDEADSGSPTNDNRAIYDLLDDITLTNTAASSVSTTLETSAKYLTSKLDQNLSDFKSEITEINVVRAGEIEYEIQMLKSKNANFLRAIELSFDAQAQNTNGIIDALNTEREIPKGSILSILT
jgi:hypothetical protein